MRVILAMLGVVFLFAGCASQQPSNPLPPADSARPQITDTVPPSERLEQRDSLRDSIQFILKKDASYDSTGAVLAWKDTLRWKLGIVLVNLEPSDDAFRRIRGQMAEYILHHDRVERVGVDLDEPPPVPTDDGEAKDSLPSLQNADEVQSLLRKLDPQKVLSGCGESVRAMFWVFVDWRGGVLHATLEESIGTASFDTASFNKASAYITRHMRFRPATHNGRPIGMWLRQRIEFACK